MSADSFYRDYEEVLERTEAVWRDLRGSRIFITGATGFFGSWLLGTALHAIDRLHFDVQILGLSRDPSRFIAKSPSLALHPCLKWIQGDVKSFTFPDGEWSHVIHAGVDASATAHAADPLGTFDSIVDGTRQCLRFAAQHGVKRFLNISSGAVYGRQDFTLPFPDEETLRAPDPSDPRSAYAEAKRAAETLSVIMAKQAGFEAVNARCFAFVGPYQPMNSSFAIGNFIANAVEGKPIVIQGDGSPVRSYLYAADLADALWTLLIGGNSGGAYNVGACDPIDLSSLANMVKDLVGAPEVRIMKLRDIRVPQDVYVPDVGKGTRELGLSQRVSLKDAIVRTADWYRSTL